MLALFPFLGTEEKRYAAEVSEVRVTLLESAEAKMTAVPKPVKHRDRALLDLAHRINYCQILIPEVCRGYVPEGCEPVHANWSSWSGKGTATKAHDCLFAAGCHACHVEIDQGMRYPKLARQAFWQDAFWRTQVILWSEGWVAVVGAPKKRERRPQVIAKIAPRRLV